MAEEAEMHRIGILFTEALKDKLTKEHGKDTGKLASSINYRLDGDDVVITMEDYAEYLEYGAPPHFPPPKELEGWVRRKWGKSGKEAESAAWVLARHIAKYGTRPFPFIRQTIKEDLPKILGK
tara:strand:- start:2 stop:370 length:369 start_codon:yes stop_codon:yes gene_type:complete